MTSLTRSGDSECGLLCERTPLGAVGHGEKERGTRRLTGAGFRRLRHVALGLALLMAAICGARADAVLELFQMTWPQLTQKMPELAEAGYTSLWLPPPAKGGSSVSIGYDCFDPFDLGNTNQNGFFSTYYGTQAQLIQMVQTAHRFGIRIYFDNIMNHRTAVVPGYNAYTPTNYYPGMLPQDFHLKTTTANGGLYA